MVHKGVTMSKKWTEQDVPDQTGRVAVVTGGNTGLGFETARVLAGRGATVVLAVRDVEKGKTAAARIGGDVAVQALDLTSLESVRDAASELRTKHASIDLLINNAGVMQPLKQTTRDGFELHFGTNHLGHFAFTGLLLDLLLPVPGSRVVTVSSLGHKWGGGAIHFDDLQWDRSYDSSAAYGQSKLANLLFAYQLQRRLAPRGTTISVAAHPGVANTEMMFRHAPAALRVLAPVIGSLFSQSPAKGALPSLRAATDPTVLGGQYYGPDGIRELRGNPHVVSSSPQSLDEAVQQHLWTVSEDLTGVIFPASGFREPRPAGRSG